MVQETQDEVVNAMIDGSEWEECWGAEELEDVQEDLLNCVFAVSRAVWSWNVG